MPDIKFLLKISRPRFWIYVFGPYIIGLAAAAENISDLYTFGALLFGAYFLFPANLLIYGINDIFDYETDKRNEKKRGYETLVEPDYRRRLLLYICLFNIPFIIAACFFPWTQIAALGGFLFFSIFYSALPIRAKTKPVLDSVFNILYVFPGIFGYTLVSGNIPPKLAIFGAGLWTMAMHAYSAIPDISADRQSKISTIATMLGTRGTLFLCFFCYALSAAILYKFIGLAGILLGISYAAMIIVSFVFQKSDRIFEVYRLFPALNTITGFILFWLIAYSKIV